VVTVGSFHAGTKSNIIGDDAKLALTVRSYTPETRKLLLDGIRRIVRGEAIAAGMPDDRMPTVEIEQPSADATFNTAELSDHLLKLFGSHFGAARVVETKPIMASEDSAVSGLPTSPSRA
jgi:Metal-dependent amidase/aminoacylase/carboxypeptidase